MMKLLYFFFSVYHAMYKCFKVSKYNFSFLILVFRKPVAKDNDLKRILNVFMFFARLKEKLEKLNKHKKIIKIVKWFVITL